MWSFFALMDISPTALSALAAADSFAELTLVELSLLAQFGQAIGPLDGPHLPAERIDARRVVATAWMPTTATVV